MVEKKVNLTIQEFTLDDDLRALYPVRQHPITPSETIPSETEMIQLYQKLMESSYSFWVARDPHDRIVGYGLFPFKGPIQGFFPPPRMHPAYRYPKAIHQLLGGVEGCARHHGLTFLSNSIKILEGAAYDYLHQGFRDAGFTVWYCSWEMVLTKDDYTAPSQRTVVDFRSLNRQTEEDMALIGTLGSLTFRNYPSLENRTASEFRNMIEEQQATFAGVFRAIAGFQGEQPIGFGIYLEVRSGTADPQEREGVIQFLGVHPDYRGQGYGSAFLEYMIDGLLAEGITKIFLAVAAENESAIQLYKKIGFQETERGVHYRKLLKT
jgi:ribosomal protein S18 acetylase RimI-like enzyme